MYIFFVFVFNRKSRLKLFQFKFVALLAKSHTCCCKRYESDALSDRISCFTLHINEVSCCNMLLLKVKNISNRMIANC